MSFLNAALLLGGLAVAIPLAIHLLSRRRHPPVRWGAMFLIEQVVRQDRRRLRLEQLILLAMRCGVIALLAVAMARPVMTGWRALAGAEPTSVVAIVDRSYAMAAATPGGPPAYEEAQRVLAEIAETLPPRSDLRIVLAGGASRHLETPDTPAAIEALAQRPPVRGRADIGAALLTAARLLEDAPRQRREIVVISDLQRTSLAGDIEAWRAHHSATSAPPLLCFVHLPTEPGPNASLEQVRLTPAIPSAGRPVHVTATVRNTGQEHLPDLSVRLIEGGQVRDAARISLAPGALGEVAFVHRFEEPGRHNLHIQLSGDSFEPDNILHVTVEVPLSVPVLLVHGPRERPFPDNAADLLELALDPRLEAPGSEDGGGAAGASGPLDVRSVSWDLLDPEEITDHRLVILADVPSLSPAAVRALRSFVSTGGALLILPGDHAEASFYNGPSRSSEGGVLPATLADLHDGQEHLAAGPYAHPALLPFNHAESDGLGEAGIWRWYELRPEPGAETALRLEEGSPWLIEQRIGRGVVVMMASSPSPQWGDLSSRATIFVPLMQQLAAWTVEAGDVRRNVWAGQTLAWPLPEGLRAAQAWFVDPQEARRTPVNVVEHGRMLLTLPEADRPGIWRLVVEEEGEFRTLSRFAVNVPRFVLDSLDRAEARKLAADMGAALVADAQEYAQLDRERRYGREAWQLVWLAVLALLFAELIAGGIFSQRHAREVPA